jgi:DNA (cytosine-5)-methyltransferase 1
VTLRSGGLFSGSGILEEVIRDLFGAQPAWFCEYEPPTESTPKPTQAAARLLAHRYPGVPNLGDITRVDWAATAPVDLLAGGFPCTDVSTAGKRAGLKPGTRSGLWSHMAYAIAQLHPKLVVIENVRGLLSADASCDLEPCPWCVGDSEGRPLRALGAVLGDLAQLGYDARWVGLPASDVGAPHERWREFITARPTADHHRIGPVRARRTRGRWPGPTDNPGPSGGPVWDIYGPAIRRWEAVIGRPAPDPILTGPRGGVRLSPRFGEWLMGWPAGWVTEVPGISSADQIKILGNGVVPQQAAAALTYLLGG